MRDRPRACENLGDLVRHRRLRVTGTEELTGLSGRLTIDIVEGKHSYGFDYTLNETP